MATYRYTGRAYKQATDPSAPWLVSFVAPADELTIWSGVPRRSEQNRSGFQRVEDQGRVDQAKEYFQQPLNQSPTSLILGLHGSLSPSISARLDFEVDEDDATAGSRPCVLTVTYDPPTPQDARDVVSRLLRGRLGSVELPSPDEEDTNPSSSSTPRVALAEDDAHPANGLDFLEIPDSSEGAADDDLPDEIEYAQLEDEDLPEEGHEELELGQSVLANLLENMQDDNWLSDTGNAEAVIDLAKPATIIDGQHRLLGAEATERGIPFSVVALVDCPWAEQVFQFTVVNYTAKGIPDQFITANAALSLTKPELDTLKTRLVQANVKIKEYDLMRVVNFDTRSPFSGLINLTEKPNKQLIGYKTMVQVAAQWFDAKHQVFNTLLPRLYPEITGKGQKAKRRERWREGDWGEFFLAFWQEVHTKFHSEESHEPARTLWDVGHSQLTIAVVLLEMQRAFLDNLNAQDEEYFDVENGPPLSTLTGKVRQRAKKFVAFFPPKFFATKWGISSLNTGSGRVDLQSCIGELVNSKGKYQYASDRLITGG